MCVCVSLSIGADASVVNPEVLGAAYVSTASAVSDMTSCWQELEGVTGSPLLSQCREALGDAHLALFRINNVLMQHGLQLVHSHVVSGGSPSPQLLTLMSTWFSACTVGAGNFDAGRRVSTKALLSVSVWEDLIEGNHRAGARHVTAAVDCLTACGCASAKVLTALRCRAMHQGRQCVRLLSSTVRQYTMNRDLLAQMFSHVYAAVTAGDDATTVSVAADEVCVWQQMAAAVTVLSPADTGAVMRIATECSVRVLERAFAVCEPFGRLHTRVDADAAASADRCAWDGMLSAVLASLRHLCKHSGDKKVRSHSNCP